MQSVPALQPAPCASAGLLTTSGSAKEVARPTSRPSGRRGEAGSASCYSFTASRSGQTRCEAIPIVVHGHEPLGDAERRTIAQGAHVCFRIGHVARLVHGVGERGADVIEPSRASVSATMGFERGTAPGGIERQRFICSVSSPISCDRSEGESRRPVAVSAPRLACRLTCAPVAPVEEGASRDVRRRWRMESSSRLASAACFSRRSRSSRAFRSGGCFLRCGLVCRSPFPRRASGLQPSSFPQRPSPPRGACPPVASVRAAWRGLPSSAPAWARASGQARFGGGGSSALSSSGSSGCGLGSGGRTTGFSSGGRVGGGGRAAT